MEAIDGTRDIATEQGSHNKQSLEAQPIVAPPRRSAFISWLVQNSPFITMLLLALIGVTFRMSVGYWMLLTPVFAVICVIAGWRHVETREARMRLVYAQALDWFAFILAIYVLHNNGVGGVLNANASALALMTLLALGTFVAGVQARVWQICAVGVALLVAVPGVGWADQSVLLLVAATLALIAIGGLVWWLEQRRYAAA